MKATCDVEYGIIHFQAGQAGSSGLSKEASRCRIERPLTLVPPSRTPSTNPPKSSRERTRRPPLCGRRCPLLAGCTPRQGLGHVLVAYRPQRVRSVPLPATSLALPRPTHAPKRTAPARTALLALAAPCEERSGPPDLQTAGGTGPHRTPRHVLADLAAVLPGGEA